MSVDDLIIILFVVTIGLLVFALIQASPKRPYRRRRRYDPDLARQRQLRAQLDSLTRDPEASNRLVDQIYARNRHQTRAWCLEKAILDIERDRR